MKYTHLCAALTTELFFTKLEIEPNFPFLADEIAVPRPDMNIKVTAFTVSETVCIQCSPFIIRLVMTHNWI